MNTESFPVNCQVVIIQNQYNIEAGTEGTVTKNVSSRVCEVSFNSVTMWTQLQSQHNTPVKIA